MQRQDLFFGRSLQRQYRDQSSNTTLLGTTHEDDKQEFMKLCWEAERDARFVLETENVMRAETPHSANHELNSTQGSPYRDDTEGSRTTIFVLQGRGFFGLDSPKSGQDKSVKKTYQHKRIKDRNYPSAVGLGEFRKASPHPASDFRSVFNIRNRKAVPTTKPKSRSDIFLISNRSRKTGHDSITSRGTPLRASNHKPSSLVMNAQENGQRWRRTKGHFSRNGGFFCLESLQTKRNEITDDSQTSALGGYKFLSEASSVNTTQQPKNGFQKNSNIWVKKGKSAKSEGSIFEENNPYEDRKLFFNRREAGYTIKTNGGESCNSVNGKTASSTAIRFENVSGRRKNSSYESKRIDPFGRELSEREQRTGQSKNRQQGQAAITRNSGLPIPVDVREKRPATAKKTESEKEISAINNFEDLRLSLLGTNVQNTSRGESRSSANTANGRDKSAKSSLVYGGNSDSNSRHDDYESTDEEVAFITGHGSRSTISEGDERRRSLKVTKPHDDLDSLFGDAYNDPYYEAKRLDQIRKTDGKKFSFVSRAMRNPMRKFTFSCRLQN